MSMTLLQLRTKAAQLSGRYDLVNPSTFVDNGMDFFITAAQNWLDRHNNTPKSTSRIWEEVAAGTWYYNFQKCRRVEEVWINNTTGRTQLEKKNFVELRNLYTSTIANTDQGTPLYYSPAYLRTDDNTDIDSLGAFFNNVLSSSDGYHGIILLPPPDESIVIEVKGLFYSADLDAEDATNFWSVNYEDIFVMAILRELEIFNRNTEGVRDWTLAIDQKLLDIEHDMINESIQDVNQIED